MRQRTPWRATLPRPPQWVLPTWAFAGAAVDLSVAAMALGGAAVGGISAPETRSRGLGEILIGPSLLPPNVTWVGLQVRRDGASDGASTGVALFVRRLCRKSARP